MRKEYDFSKSEKNPYTKILKKQMQVKRTQKSTTLEKHLVVLLKN